MPGQLPHGAQGADSEDEPDAESEGSCRGGENVADEYAFGRAGGGSGPVLEGMGEVGGGDEADVGRNEQAVADPADEQGAEEQPRGEVCSGDLSEDEPAADEIHRHERRPTMSTARLIWPVNRLLAADPRITPVDLGMGEEVRGTSTTSPTRSCSDSQSRHL